MAIKSIKVSTVVTYDDTISDASEIVSHMERIVANEIEYGTDTAFGAIHGIEEFVSEPA